FAVPPRVFPPAGVPPPRPRKSLPRAEPTRPPPRARVPRSKCPPGANRSHPLRFRGRDLARPHLSPRNPRLRVPKEFGRAGRAARRDSRRLLPRPRQGIWRNRRVFRRGPPFRASVDASAQAVSVRGF
ncbi:MAG: hypothetical protein BJ554DRAFT_3041, partial [Olpidium bornovanus]